MPENTPTRPSRKQRGIPRGGTRHTPGTGTRPAVAFIGTDDAHALDGNPNTGKRHASKMDNRARLTPRQYSPGTPDGKRHYMPTLETRWERVPSLGSHLSKRPLTGESRG